MAAKGVENEKENCPRPRQCQFAQKPQGEKVCRETLNAVRIAVSSILFAGFESD
jgi:hypothetical protein